MSKKIEEKGILEVTKTEQYHTVDELFRRSQPGSVYYTLLILSSVIVASGLLLGNAPIVIGGMLITPVLSPVLVIALGIAVGEPQSIRGVTFLILKSIFIVSGSALILAFLFGGTRLEEYLFDGSMRTAVLYFVVAIASGSAATFGWVRKEIAEVLPGIAIAVSLVPPLSLVGIGLAMFSVELVRFYALVFAMNLFGIIAGSLAAFSLLKFSRTEKYVAKEAEAVEKVREKKRESKRR